MYKFGLRLLAIFLLFAQFRSYAQDKIYLKSKITTCSIIAVDQNSVTYLPMNSSSSSTMDMSKVILLFNSKGMYLVPSKMDFSLPKTDTLVKKFLLGEKSTLTTDYLFKTDNTIATGDVWRTDKYFIYMGKEEKMIDRKYLAAIIYRDGTHEVMGPINTAADVLWAAYENNFSSTSPANVVAKKDSVIKPEPVPEVKTVTQQTAEPTRADTVTKVVATPAPAVADTTKAAASDIPPFDKEEFKQKAKDKVQRLTDYIKILCAKKDDEEMNLALSQAILLFVNEDATVEVSSTNHDPVRKKIRAYLTDLKLLPYDKVEITWTNVQYVSDIKKRSDGNYSGMVQFEQQFKGYRDGKLIYSDETSKKTLVILKTYEKNVNGNTQSLWDVLLGDIGVESTRSL